MQAVSNLPISAWLHLADLNGWKIAAGGAPFNTPTPDLEHTMTLTHPPSSNPLPQDIGRGQLTGPKQAIKMGDYVVEEVASTRCLGAQIDNALKWDHHLSELRSRLRRS